MTSQASSENFESGLKTILKDDWGYSLSLEPGLNGDGSKKNPIKISSSEPTEISRTAFFTVQGLHRGLSESHKKGNSNVTGVLWRVVDPLKLDKQESLLSMRVERIILTENKKITETVSYYFDVVNKEAEMGDTFPLPPGFSSNKIKLKMPYEIGWLQYKPDQTINYKKAHDRPDLGYGFEFNAIGIEATSYIYPLPNLITDNTLLDEFEKSAKEVRLSTKEQLIPWPDRNIDGRLYRRYWAVGEGAAKGTALWLFRFKGQFAKVRITWERDHTLDEVAMEFLDKFTTALLKN